MCIELYLIVPYKPSGLEFLPRWVGVGLVASGHVIGRLMCLFSRRHSMDVVAALSCYLSVCEYSLQKSKECVRVVKPAYGEIFSILALSRAVLRQIMDITVLKGNLPCALPKHCP